MHMTLETDYAVRIMETLTREGKRVDARTISEKTRVPQRFALKILRSLVADGLVRSYKGASGGYELARCPGGNHPSGGHRVGGRPLSDQPVSGR